jgi:hypothetical protein
VTELTYRTHHRKGHAMRKQYAFLSMLMFISTAAVGADNQVPQCAARLQPSERMIYDAAIAINGPRAVSRASIRAATIALVREGRLAMRVAPKAAQAAALCLVPTNASAGD